MRREAASMRIQKHCRLYLARNAYKNLCSSAVSLQSGVRGMAARNELKFKKQKRAAIIIQVNFIFCSYENYHLRVLFLIFCFCFIYIFETMWARSLLMLLISFTVLFLSLLGMPFCILPLFLGFCFGIFYFNFNCLKKTRTLSKLSRRLADHVIRTWMSEW